MTQEDSKRDAGSDPAVSDGVGRSARGHSEGTLRTGQKGRSERLDEAQDRHVGAEKLDKDLGPHSDVPEGP